MRNVVIVEIPDAERRCSELELRAAMERLETDADALGRIGESSRPWEAEQHDDHDAECPQSQTERPTGSSHTATARAPVVIELDRVECGIHQRDARRETELRAYV